MRDALNGGYTKLLDASFDKIAGLFIGILFKGLTLEIAGCDLFKKLSETAQKSFKTDMKLLIGSGSAVSFGFNFIPFDEQPSACGTMFTDFHAYIAGMYNPKTANNTSRSLISDLKTTSTFIQQQQAYTSSSPVPSITLNGTVKKPYFESAFFAMPMNHTQYKCVDDFKEKSAETFLNDAVAEYERMSTAGPLIYGGVVAAVTAAKVAIAFASPVPDVWGLISAGAGVWTSIPKFGEISSKFTKGAKWLKQESDLQWLNMIGATATEEYQVTVLQDPCGTSLLDNPDCLDPLQEVTITRTRVITLPNDALVPVFSQANPREANWKPGQGSELNLNVETANHFSQANNPRVRQALNRVFNSEVGPTFQDRDAFRVRIKP